MAINIKEFRHGNALYSEGEIVFFRGLCSNEVVIKNNKLIYSVKNDKDLKPIPLTEKWLLDFGFNKIYKKGYIGKDFSNQDFILTEPFFINDLQKGYAFQFNTGGWLKYKELNYVHELQNFYFAITGEELLTTVKKDVSKNSN